MESTYNIEYVRGHYEAYDENERFVCSGDTWDECYNDLKAMIVSKIKDEIEMENGEMVVA